MQLGLIFNTSKNQFDLSISSAFDIKEALKSRGYKFSEGTKEWDVSFKINDFEDIVKTVDEINFLKDQGVAYNVDFSWFNDAVKFVGQSKGLSPNQVANQHPELVKKVSSLA